MKEFPKYILFQAFFNLIALFLSIFFLFGGVLSPQNEVGDAVRLLIYIAVQLLWVLPVASTFIGLNQYRLGFRGRSVFVLTLGNLLTLVCILLLFF